MTRTVEVVYEGGVLRPLEPLPFAENQRLRITVSEEEKQERPGEPDLYRRKEMDWIGLHAKEYPGEYVALSGNRLLSHGKDRSEVVRLAIEQGEELPLIHYCPPADELPFGGW